MEIIKLVNPLVHEFTNFLNDSWKAISNLKAVDNLDSFISNWMQSTWEFLVEQRLSVDHGPLFLEVYADGADIYDKSSRISFENELPSHSIHFGFKHNHAVDLLTGSKFQTNSDALFDFQEFVSMNNGWYVRASPFDKVLFKINGIDALVSLEELNFFLVKI